QVRDHVIVAVRDRIRPQLAPSLERLLRLQVRAGDAMQAGVIAADSRSHARAELARSLLDLGLKLGDELTRRLRVGDCLGRPQHDEGAGIGGEDEGASTQLERVRDLRESLPATLAAAMR